MFENEMNFDLIPIHKVSSYEFNDMDKEDVSIIHFKGGLTPRKRPRTVEETIQRRIEERGFKDYCGRYLASTPERPFCSIT
jgi:hypothetical protein